MCYGYHIWSKEFLMQVKNDDLHGGQRSTEVKRSKLCYMAIKLGQINRWCKFRMMATLMEVKDQQRSNIVNNDLWLPNLVRRFADTSLGWLWPSQRSKVSKGHNKQFFIATKLGQKSSSSACLKFESKILLHTCDTYNCNYLPHTSFRLLF